MLKRSGKCAARMSRYTGVEIDPYTAKSIFIFGFVASISFLSAYAARETKKVGPIELPQSMEAQRKRQNDPRRPPWPLLHQRVVLLREGKGSPEDIALIWQQAKYYYPADWLIPLELIQVLKYSNATFLQNYVPDPDLLRKEILTHMMDVKYGRVKDETGSRVNRDVKEILSIAIADLEQLDLSGSREIPLVPKQHT